MQRYFYAGGAGALTLGLLGWNIWLGAVIGMALAIVTAPRAPSKRVIVEDIYTGKIEVQPNDKATQRYIAGRGE